MTTPLNENRSNEETMVIVLLDGPYISQYADIGYKMAKSALNLGYVVKIFLYMDGVHIPRKDQNPRDFPKTSRIIEELIEKGCEIKACVRCAAARGYLDQSHYVKGVQITSVYDLAEWMDENNKVVILGS
ncbi:DsrE/DsrF/TusD sulfur relay family protein [Methanobacterium sp.]|uniref:DsrE/DsrF/TusD sulfur relay family protein n=1 Tax=Methanobacterium sp. TaxID=2164 RepID=UPI0025E4AA48|nr:DsrE family protein [Methanobacterium sp.]MBI5460270.1 DsrE family protein [Methanobacterium sp.]MDY9923634.1 DsrE family protein [Methanobacterium sp.]